MLGKIEAKIKEYHVRSLVVKCDISNEEEVKNMIDELDDKLIFMECPLLFETDFIDLCDYSIVVYSDMDNQIKRLMERDGINFPQALNRIYAQMSIVEKMERADFIIDNCHGFSELEWQTTHIIKKNRRDELRCLFTKHMNYTAKKN